MSLRRRIQTDVPETEGPDGCCLDGGPRRMSPRRRIQTEVPETEDPDGSPRDGRPGRTGTENVPQTECQDGWAHYLGFPSEGHACVPSALVLRFGDGCHRRMSLRRTTRADWHRRMSLRRKVKMGGPAVLAFLLRDIHVCHLPWPYVSETDVTDGCP